MASYDVHQLKGLTMAYTTKTLSNDTLISIMNKCLRNGRPFIFSNNVMFLKMLMLRTDLSLAVNRAGTGGTVTLRR